MTTKIELLYFEDCPNWRKGLELLKNIFDDLRITQEIHLVKIENEEEAKKA